MSAQRGLWGSAAKRFSASGSRAGHTQAPCATSRFVDFSRCAAAASAPPAPAALGVAVHAAFLGRAEHDALLAEASAALARRAFERGHWDGVIAHFREEALPLARASPALRAAALRAHALFPPLPPALQPQPQPRPKPRALLPQAHLLELEARGRISRHVDSVKFSGGVVAGLCLDSDAVLRLSVSDEAAAEASGEGGKGGAGAVLGAGAEEKEEGEEGSIDVLLPRGCLYVLSGEARYLWAHAIADGSPRFRGEPVPRRRRVSIMLRDALDEAAERPTPLAGSFAERVLRSRRAHREAVR